VHDGYGDDQDTGEAVAAEHNRVIEAFMEECGLSLDKVDSMDWEGRLRLVAYLSGAQDDPTPAQLDAECQAIQQDAEDLALELGLMAPGGDEWRSLLFPNCYLFAVDSVRDAGEYLQHFASQYPVCQTLAVSFSELRSDAERVGSGDETQASRDAADNFNAMRSYFFADSDLPDFARHLFARIAAKVGALSHRPRLGAELLPPWFLSARSGMSPVLDSHGKPRASVLSQVRGWRKHCMSGIGTWHSDHEWADDEQG
jgi:hypothetical protein